MLIIYDNTFTGFLTAVFDAFCTRDEVEIICESRFMPTLESYTISQTNKEKAHKVLAVLEEKAGKSAVDTVYTTWLSHRDGIDTVLVDYIKLCMKMEHDPIDMRQNETVYKVAKTARNVSEECHRFLGFIRFRKLEDDIFIADMTPDNDILPLIKRHFIDRFHDQKFMIRDLSYKRILMYDGKGHSVVGKLSDAAVLDYANNDEFEHMWCSYYKVMTIKERLNPRCQMNFMPKKYWKNIIEKSPIYA
ncbi:MAG: DNA metabolism protein [Ruminococcaceae bacterium]|nr:DNA metabolism protein [Oscillospiraceae bacterium]